MKKTFAELADDRKYLVDMQLGNEEAVAFLLEKYYTSLYNYGLKFSADKELVKDTIQEVFISLWQRRETATTILSLKYYLLRAIKNKMLQSLNKLSGRSKYLDSLPYDFHIEFSAEKKIIEYEIAEKQQKNIGRILLQLPPK